VKTNIFSALNIIFGDEYPAQPTIGKEDLFDLLKNHTFCAMRKHLQYIKDG